MKRILITLFAIIAVVSFSYSQNDTQAVKNKINEIKLDKSSSYIYAEAVDSSPEEAHRVAKAILTESIQSWIRTKLPTADINSVVAKIDSYTQNLSFSRGRKAHDVFLYVKKGDIYALLPVNRVTMIPEVDEHKETKREDLQIDKEVTHHQSKYAEVEQPEKVESKIAVNNIVIDADDNELLSDIIDCSNLSEVKKILDSEKYKRKYYHFKVNMQRDKSFLKEKEALMVIYDIRNENIRAFLRTDSNGSLTNIQTRQSDNFAEYPDCIAIAIVETE